MPEAIRHFAILAAVATLGCASPPRYTTAPGSSADRTVYRIESLAFEAPSGFREGSVPLFDFLLSPPSSMAHGGSRGLTLSFCTARTEESCGVLGVRRGTDLGSRCSDPEAIRHWYRTKTLPEGMVAVQYTGRSGWLITPTDPRAYSSTLILCDGDQYWYVRSIATGLEGIPPARFAFDLFLRTVQLEPTAFRPAT